MKGIFTFNGAKSPILIHYLFFELFYGRRHLLESWKFFVCCSSCNNLQFLRWQLVTIRQELLQEDVAIIQPQIRMVIKTVFVLQCLQYMSYILHSHRSGARLKKNMWSCIPIHKYKVIYSSGTKKMQTGVMNSWRIKDHLDVTCYFISLLMCSTCFRHQYNHHQELVTILLNYHIGRIVLGSMCVGVSVWLGWRYSCCRLKPATRIIQQNSHKLLMMDILMSETCWAHKKWNKIASDNKLVFLFFNYFSSFHKK